MGLASEKSLVSPRMKENRFSEYAPDINCIVIKTVNR